ncbi:MAG: hypothetical protein MI757_03995, partial [Pirellulales bacterium]|nr:hypothetical protein [Pirellulales bacterium]
MQHLNLTAIVSTAIFAVINMNTAHATMLVQVDLELSGSPADQQTQADWNSQTIDSDSEGNANSYLLTLTAGGNAAGITATLAGDTDGLWEARGGSPHNRAQVTGTSFNDVVEDLWATR